MEGSQSAAALQLSAAESTTLRDVRGASKHQELSSQPGAKLNPSASPALSFEALCHRSFFLAKPIDAGWMNSIPAVENNRPVWHGRPRKRGVSHQNLLAALRSDPQRGLAPC